MERLSGISRGLFLIHCRTSISSHSSWISISLSYMPISISHSIYFKCFVSVHISPVALLQMSFVAWQFPRLSEVKSRLPAIQRHRLGAALSRLRVKSTYSWMHGTYS